MRSSVGPAAASAESEGTPTRWIEASERSVTGMVVTAVNLGAAAELRTTIAPAWSPGCAGLETVSEELRVTPRCQR